MKTTFGIATKQKRVKNIYFKPNSMLNGVSVTKDIPAEAAAGGVLEHDAAGGNASLQR